MRQRSSAIQTALRCALGVACCGAFASAYGNDAQTPSGAEPPATTQPTSRAASQSASQPATQPASAATDLKDAVEIFRRADAATAAVQTVRYDAQFRTQGPAAARSPVVMGTVLLSGKAANGLAQARIGCTVEQGRALKKEKIEIGTDGKTFFLIDPAAKKIHADDTNVVLGAVGTNALYVVLREFGRAAPFADEIAAVKCERMGNAEIGGVACYELRVTYDDKGRQATWFIGKSDYLPRKVVRVLRTGDKQIGSTELILEKLEVNPKIEGAPFAVPTMAGFERVKTPHGVK